MEDVWLADFSALYIPAYKNTDYKMREHACIIRYCNYDMADKISKCKRKMVTLFIYFRYEHTEITNRMKYLQLFDEQQEAILRKFAEYQQISENTSKSTIDYAKIYRKSELRLTQDKIITYKQWLPPMQMTMILTLVLETYQLLYDSAQMFWPQKSFVRKCT